MAIFDRLIEVLLDGDAALTVSEVQALRERGVGVEDIVSHGLERAMSKLDAKCTAEQFNLLEIMLTGRAATEAMKILYPDDIPVDASKGTVVMASLKGDIHDLGKNILGMVLKANRYRAIDCGRDCAVHALVASTVENAADVICVSGLITSVIPQVRTIRESLRSSGLDHVRILAGGAALRQY